MATAVLAACGGGGGGSSSVPNTGSGGGGVTTTPAPGSSTPALAANQRLVSLSMTIPHATTAANKRTPKLIDSGTQSIQFTLLQASDTTATVGGSVAFDTTPTAANCQVVNTNTVCTFAIAAPIGTDIFLATTYSQPQEVNKLGSGALQINVQANATNSANLTLQGPIASVLLVSTNAANQDNLYNGLAEENDDQFFPITYAQFNGQQQAGGKARTSPQRLKPQVLITPAPAINSERLYLIASDASGQTIFNPTTYNQSVTLTLSQRGGPVNSTLTVTSPFAGTAGCSSGAPISADGSTVQVCSPFDTITLDNLPNVVSPEIECCDVLANFPFITATLPAPPAGYTPVVFPYTVQNYPTPTPTGTPQATLPVTGQ